MNRRARGCASGRARICLSEPIEALSVRDRKLEAGFWSGLGAQMLGPKGQGGMLRSNVHSGGQAMAWNDNATISCSTPEGSQKANERNTLMGTGIQKRKWGECAAEFRTFLLEEQSRPSGSLSQSATPAQLNYRASWAQRIPRM